METTGPILLTCGLVCIWPGLLALAGFYIGRHGLPVEIRRRSAPTPNAEGGDWLKGSPKTTAAARRYADD